MIIHCTETIDTDEIVFPNCLYCVKFYGVHFFSIQNCNCIGNDFGQYDIKNKEPRTFFTGEIDTLTKEVNINNKHYYCLKTSEQKPNLETHFDTVEILFLCENDSIDKFEKGVMFLSPKTKTPIGISTLLNRTL